MNHPTTPKSAARQAEPTPLRRATNTRRHGGKAAVLARLLNHSLPVPDGLVVGTDIPDDRLPDAAAHIAAWARAAAPHGLVLRSSAPNEDGPSMSYAGLYTSVFTTAADSADPAAVLAALTTVRASAHSPAVAAYARAHAETPPRRRIAVLVQPALRPRAAGVLAAAHRRGRLGSWRIESGFGLAGLIVSGEQAGDVHTGHGIRRPPTLAHLADKPRILLPACVDDAALPPAEWLDLPDADAATGVVPAKVLDRPAGMLTPRRPAAWDGRAALPTARQRTLLSLAARAAAVAGLGDLDAEWVLDHDGTVHLVQLRPLTTPLPDSSQTPAPPVRPGVLRGHPSAPGRASGPVHHLTARPAERGWDDDELAAVRGRVLVCRALGPEAVPALCAAPAALVTTTGGTLSHAAIVARELELPCVTAVPHAASLPPGTPVHVDGTAGTVSPHEPATTNTPARRTGTTPQPRPQAAHKQHIRVVAAAPADADKAVLVLCAPHAPATPAGPDRAPRSGSPAPGHGYLVLDGAQAPDCAAHMRRWRAAGVGTVLWPRTDPPAPHLVVTNARDRALVSRTVDLTPLPDDSPSGDHRA